MITPPTTTPEACRDFIVSHVTSEIDRGARAAAICVPSETFEWMDKTPYRDLDLARGSTLDVVNASLAPMGCLLCTDTTTKDAKS